MTGGTFLNVPIGGEKKCPDTTVECGPDLKTVADGAAMNGMSSLTSSSSLTGLPRELMGKILGNYLGVGQEFLLVQVCKIWKELMDSPEYTVNTTLPLSEWTIGNLPRSTTRRRMMRLMSAADDGNSGSETSDDSTAMENFDECCSESSSHRKSSSIFHANERAYGEEGCCSDRERLLRRVSVHRGRVLIQTNFLRPGRSDTGLTEWLSYVKVVFDILDHVRHVSAFAFHDASLGSDVDEFMARLSPEASATMAYGGNEGTCDEPLIKSEENVLRRARRKKTSDRGSLSEIGAHVLEAELFWRRRASGQQGSDDTDCDSLESDSTAEYNDKQEATEHQSLEKQWTAFFQGKLAGEWRGSSWLLVQGLARRLAQVIKSSRTSLERLSLRGKIVEEAFARTGGGKEQLLERVNYLCVPTPILGCIVCPNVECLHVLRASNIKGLLGFLTKHSKTLACLGVNLHDITSHEVDEEVNGILQGGPYWQTHAVREWRGLAERSLADNENAGASACHRFSELHQESSTAKSAANAWKGIELPRLEALHFQVTHRDASLRLLDFLHCPVLKLLKIMKIGVGSGARNKAHDGLIRMVDFLRKNGGELTSLHVDGKAYDAIMGSNCLLPRAFLPKLVKANVSAHFFCSVLSSANETPNLRSLILPRLPPARPANRHFFTLLNSRESIRRVVLPAQETVCAELSHVTHLKIVGWACSERLAFQSLSKLRKLTLSCSVSWHSLQILLAAANHLSELWLGGGLVGVVDSALPISESTFAKLSVIHGCLPQPVVDFFLAHGFWEARDTAPTRLLRRCKRAAVEQLTKSSSLAGVEPLKSTERMQHVKADNVSNLNLKSIAPSEVEYSDDESGDSSGEYSDDEGSRMSSMMDGVTAFSSGWFG